MLLRLVVFEGPRKGEEVLIKDEVIIGRKGVDLNLLDPKVSSRHARIFKNDQGVITIEDLGSSNGTFVNDIKVTTWSLKIGDKVQIGRSIMRVEDEPAPQKAMERGTWQEVIEAGFNDLTQELEKNPKEVAAGGVFDSPVTLEFIKGLQAGTTLTYGFGPRALGKFCPDGLLYDPQATDVAFELHPFKGALCELRTKVADVKVNEKPLKGKKPNFRTTLKNGDRISVGQTVIVVKSEEKL